MRGKVQRRIADSYQAQFTYDDDVVDSIAKRCTEVDTGARNVDHILSRTMLPELSAEFLARLADGQAIESAHISMGEGQGFQYHIK